MGVWRKRVATRAPDPLSPEEIPLNENDMLAALAFYVVFVFSVTCHEAAHAWAAKQGGDLTAYLGGQVSLDPIPHMKREPIGMVLLPLITVTTMGFPFGYASAPYSVAWAQQYPRRAAWMALAGPAANLALVLIAAVAIHIGVGMGALEAPDSISFRRIVAAAGEAGLAESATTGGYVAFLLSLFYSMNLLLLILNMIPLPPLDGSGALPLILPDSLNDAYQSFIQIPYLSLAVFFLVFNYFGDLFGPLFFLSISLLYPDLSYS